MSWKILVFNLIAPSANIAFIPISNVSATSGSYGSTIPVSVGLNPPDFSAVVNDI